MSLPTPVGLEDTGPPPRPPPLLKVKTSVKVNNCLGRSHRANGFSALFNTLVSDRLAVCYRKAKNHDGALYRADSPSRWQMAIDASAQLSQFSGLLIIKSD